MSMTVNKSSIEKIAQQEWNLGAASFYQSRSWLPLETSDPDTRSARLTAVDGDRLVGGLAKITAAIAANTLEAIDQNNQLSELFRTIRYRREESRETNYTTRRGATDVSATTNSGFFIHR